MVAFFSGLFLSFLFGAFPSGYLVGRIVSCVDLTKEGSLSTGATNVSRILGLFWGIVVLSIDVSKAIICVTVLPLLFESALIPGLNQQSYYGLFCIMGHVWSPFLFFKGGKGIACSLGVFLVLAPEPTFLALFLFLLALATTRYVSVASIFSALTLPWIIFFLQPSSRIVFIISLIVSTIIFRKHKPNIKRLFLGEESKFFFKKGTPSKRSENLQSK